MPACAVSCHHSPVTERAHNHIHCVIELVISGLESLSHGFMATNAAVQGQSALEDTINRTLYQAEISTGAELYLESHTQLQAAETKRNKLCTQLAAADRDLASCLSEHSATGDTLRRRLISGRHGHGGLTDLAARLEAKDPAAAATFTRILQG